MSITVLKKIIDSSDIGNQALFPVYNSDLEKVSKISIGKQILIQIKRIRNIKKHNLVFALLRMIKDYLPDDHEYKELSERAILYLIEYENGLCNVVKNKRGESISIPLSISFSKMTEEEHDRLLDAVFLACSVVTKIEISDLQKNYSRYLDGYK